MALAVLVAALFLAFVNGANDNMKGAATLYGAGSMSYRGALWLASAATAVGAVASVFVASALLAAFSGKGLVPDSFLTVDFMGAVAAGAALVVAAATLAGMPVSTTHALVGGLLGAGLVAAGSQLAVAALARVFLLPLLAGPLLAAALGYGLYRGMRAIGGAFGLRAETCLCVGRVSEAGSRGFFVGFSAPVLPGGQGAGVSGAGVAAEAFRGAESRRAARSVGALSAGVVSEAALRSGPPASGPVASMMAAGRATAGDISVSGIAPAVPATDEGFAVELGCDDDCARRFDERAGRVALGSLLEAGHVASALLLSFGRGLNDTPKLAAILAAAGLLSSFNAALAVAAAMTLGGLLAARRVAETMAHKITRISPTTGAAANAAAAALVIAASPLGLPISTTHATAGSIFGIGAAGSGVERSTGTSVASAWALTLPAAALLSALFMLLLG